MLRPRHRVGQFSYGIQRRFSAESTRFGGVTITLEDNGDTLLAGPVVDQAALHGLLKKVRDLGLPLVSVSPLEPDPSTTLPLRGLRGTGQADQSDVK